MIVWEDKIFFTASSIFRCSYMAIEYSFVNEYISFMTGKLKYSILLATLILATPAYSFAQFITFGLKGGVALSKELEFTDGKLRKPQPLEKCLLSFNGGITLNFLLKDKWILHSEILFENKGGKSESTYLDFSQDSTIKENHRKNRMFYLQFPQTIRYFILLDKNEKSKLYFELGIFFACYLLSKDVINTTTSDGESEQRAVEFYDVTQTDGAAQYSRTRMSWGITGGCGFTRQIWHGIADMNFKIDQALIPVFQDHISNQKSYHVVIAVTLGYSLPVLQKDYH